MIAGIGVKAIAGSALSGIGSGLSRVAHWLGGLNVYQLGCIALAILAGVQHFTLVAAHRHSAKVEAQLASANHALGIARANEATLKATIAKQNAAVDQLAAKSQAQQQQAAQAAQKATRRAQEAEAVSERLRQSSRVAVPPAASCAPSKALQEQWQ